MKSFADKVFVPWADGIRANEDPWREPLFLDGASWGKEERIRVYVDADWLDPEVPAERLADLLALIAKTPHLDWVLLTERPELWQTRIDAANAVGEGEDANMWDAITWLGGTPPPNVIVGVRFQDQAQADERIPELLKIPARVQLLRGVPLLGEIDLRRWLRTAGVTCGSCGRTWKLHEGDPCNHAARGSWTLACPGCGACKCVPVQATRGDAVDWRPPAHWRRSKGGRFDREGIKTTSGIHGVIAGGESGPGARPMHPDWVRSLRDQCQAAGVPFFFEGWGDWRPKLVEVAGEPRPTGKNNNWGTLTPDGAYFSTTTPWNGRQLAPPDNEVLVVRVGKEASGRELDGCEWNELSVG